MTKQSKIEGLTEREYVQRSRDLESSLRAAQAGRDKAALRFEMGEIEDGELQSALAAVSTIEARKTGLEAAWTEVQRLAGLAAAEQGSADRRRAAEKLGELESQREKEMRAIAKIIASLLPHAQNLDELTEEMARTIRPHAEALHASRDIARQEASEFIREVNDRSREREFVEAALFLAFGGWGMGIKFPGARADFDVLNQVKANVVDRIVRRLTGDDD